MTERVQPFWWFVPPNGGLLDVRVFNMVGDSMTYIEGALVEVIQAGMTVQSGYTDSIGKYVTVLGSGIYTIRISKTGYRTIEKTETLTQPTELMVNLPMELAKYGRSGIVQEFIVVEVGNPKLISKLEVITPTSKKCNITSEGEVVTPTSKKCNMTSKYTAEVT